MLSKDCVCTSSDETFYRIQSKRNTQNKALDLSGAFSLSFFAFSTRIRFRRDVWMSFYDFEDFLSISPRLAIKNSETDEISRISEIIYDKLRLRGVSFEFWNFINAKFIFLLFYEIRAKWRRPRNHLLMLLVLCDETRRFRKYRRAAGVAKHKLGNLLFCFYRPTMWSDNIFPRRHFTLILLRLTHGQDANKLG